MLKHSWVQALCAAVFVVALTGCGGDECTTATDCRAEKGNPPEGQRYTCIDNKCGLEDVPDTEVKCDPECASGETCDTSGTTGVCRTCTATAGCATPLVCDVAANSGKGQCKTCTDSATGSARDSGCTAASPVCDAAGGNGLGVCKTCVDNAQGSTADQGCTVSVPMCDATAANGVGVCKACADTATGTGTDLGCSTSSPVCDPSSAGGIGACKTCTDTAQGTDTDLGCASSAPICNTLASGGRGVCRTCADTATGTGTDLGCAASAPLCDGTANSGVGLCKACTDTATGNGIDQGCAAANPVCDPTAASGVGVCKICTDTATGSGTDVGCVAASPICDPTAGSGAGACRACQNSATGTGTDLGCSTGAPLCDATAASGVGACRACLDSAAPGNGEDLGCFNPTAICDPTASNGTGSCKVCVSTEGCPGAQTCNAAGTACEGCLDDTSCTNPSTPYCKATQTPSVCVECTTSSQCLAETRPSCNPSSNFCGCTTDAQCTAANGTTDFCDLTANNTRGECKFCVTHQNCAQLDPTKPFCDNQTACIQCRTTADCGLTSVCNASKACEAVPGADPAASSAQIAAFLAAAEGPLSPPLAIENAFITYLKPALGTDLAGFFLQAEANGPALFVEGDTSGLAVGDRITLSVTQKAVKTGVDTATSLAAAPTIVSRGHPVQNLSNATPAGLAVDLSSKPLSDFTTEATLNNYESELISLTGTIVSNSASVGSGHVGFQLNTAGTGTVAGNNSFRLRMDAAVAAQLDILMGCGFTLKAGPMWRFTPSATSNAAQPSAYYASDLVMNCPAPKLLKARAVSPTLVVLTFDRKLDETTVQATDFSVNNSLTVTSATVNAKDVTLTTSTQAAGQAYTVSVDGEVKDVGGKVVDPAAKSANFTGFAPPPSGPSLVINEIDVDNLGTDIAEFIEIHNRGGQAADLSNVLLLLVNGDAPAASPRKEYLRFPLSAVTDLSNQPVTTLPAGGYIVAGSTAYFSATALPPGTLKLVIARAATPTGQDIVQNGADGMGLVNDTTGALLDAVFYKGGSATTGNPVFDITTSAGTQSLNFVEGSLVLSRDPAAATDSIGRSPNGNDTNINDSDFVILTTASPGAANQ